MTDDQLRQRLDKIQENCLQELETQEKLQQATIKLMWENLRRAITVSGRRVCDRCEGGGKLRRPDARIMEQFNLPGWRGCPDCGGDRNKPGRGWIC